MTIEQIAAAYEIAESCLRDWVRHAVVEDGNRPGTTAAQTSEKPELMRQIRLDRITEPRGYVSAA